MKFKLNISFDNHSRIAVPRNYHYYCRITLNLWPGGLRHCLDQSGSNLDPPLESKPGFTAPSQTFSLFILLFICSPFGYVFFCIKPWAGALEFHHSFGLNNLALPSVPTCGLLPVFLRCPAEPSSESYIYLNSRDRRINEVN
jgi:hypothetical protein